MHKRYLGLFAGLVIFVCFSCEKYTGKGDPEWESRTLEPFSSFRLAMDCDVELFSSYKTVRVLQDSTYKDSTYYVHKDSLYVVRIRAAKNLFEYIETTVVGGELRIGLKGNSIVTDDDRIKIEVFSPDYRNITILTPGVVTMKMSDTLRKQFLSCIVKNRGSLNLHFVNYAYLQVNASDDGYVMSDSSGTVSKAEFDNSGNGTIDLFNLKVDSMWATTRGSGTISVNVSTYLKGTILGNGNIYYMGNPGSVVPVVTGNGRLIRL
jgi:hypothetical protein